MKTAEELAEQRAYIESLTAEQRKVFEEYAIASYEYDDACTQADYYESIIDDQAALASLIGKEAVCDVSKNLIAYYEKQSTIYREERNSALARLNELAPTGNYFNEQSGRYEEKYVCPVTLNGELFKVPTGTYSCNDILRITKVDLVAKTISVGLDSTWGVSADDRWKGLHAQDNPRAAKFSYDAFHEGLKVQEQADDHAKHVAAHWSYAGIQPFNYNEIYGSKITVRAEIDAAVQHYERTRASRADTVETKCECGAAATGIKRGATGHSSWCPWKATA